MPEYKIIKVTLFIVRRLQDHSSAEVRYLNSVSRTNVLRDVDVQVYL